MWSLSESECEHVVVTDLLTQMQTGITVDLSETFVFNIVVKSKGIRLLMKAIGQLSHWTAEPLDS